MVALSHRSNWQHFRAVCLNRQHNLSRQHRFFEAKHRHSVSHNLIKNSEFFGVKLTISLLLIIGLLCLACHLNIIQRTQPLPGIWLLPSCSDRGNNSSTKHVISNICIARTECSHTLKHKHTNTS